MLIVVLRAADPAQFEILTWKEIRIASGESFYRVEVKRSRFGTSRLALLTGDRVNEILRLPGL